MPLMPLDVQFRVLINDFLPRLHGHEIYDDTNGFINYVQNGTPKMPHRGYLLHYYILGSVKLLQSWLTSYKEGLGSGRNIYQNMWRCPNCIEKQDKKLLRVTQNRKGSSVVGSKLQCSDVTITSHLSLAIHVPCVGSGCLLTGGRHELLHSPCCQPRVNTEDASSRIYLPK